ncbi:MAG: PaaX family transcriptional regulator C-terminal domain-containing protein [Opitutaceae bacterium]|nr:PaaX family transcriptional regulator C-terminal domain-containing protein [Opitutaceae bacterium]
MKLIETRPSATSGERVVRLTNAGRKAALAGVDPKEQWTRRWDGRWRLVMFDVPEHENRRRVELRRALRVLRFGYLQNSVWISPRPMDQIRRQLRDAEINPESLVLFEGRPAGGESDQDLVCGAWDFPALQALYDDWSRVADGAPNPKAGRPQLAQDVRAWAARERSAWAAIANRDPFLPEALLPTGYAGREVWRRRVDLLRALGQSLTGA